MIFFHSQILQWQHHFWVYSWCVCVTVGDLYLVERIKIISAMFLPLKYTTRVSTIAVNPLKCFEDQEYAMNDM